MKVFLFLLSFCLLASCSVVHIPIWKQNAAANTANFIESSFVGNEVYAAKYFDKMLDDFRMTVDPDEIVRAYLAKCAVNFAILEYSGCEKAAEMLPLLKNKENITYYNFISGNIGKSEDVPQKYRDIVEISKSRNIEKANSALSAEKDPTTLLVKAAFFVKTDCYNAETVELAVNAASKEGWKKATLKYLALQLAYFEKHGEKRKAELLKKRMELVVSE